jgi:hypothetical protein
MQPAPEPESQVPRMIKKPDFKENYALRDRFPDLLRC